MIDGAAAPLAVEFGKKYQVTVLQDNNTLGKLNITIGEIKKETSGF